MDAQRILRLAQALIDFDIQQNVLVMQQVQAQ
jgi:hypothetical protein